ncbi:MAG: 30S ribosomal protein S6 [Patescibacteria group bacterium]|nr:30S ribosomal protein S6 [Patescibacteria group bacterium]
MVNHYEACYLVGANYTEEELIPIKEKIADLITKAGGQISLEDSLGKKKLSYPIKGNHQGYYLIYQFDLEKDKLKELDRNLKLTNELLRHMIVISNPKKGRFVPSIVENLTEEKVENVKTEKVEAKSLADDQGKIKLADLDEKLDEILEGKIM